MVCVVFWKYTKYEVDLNEIPPMSELYIGAVLDENNTFEGVEIAWDPSSSSAHPNFTSFILAKFKERTVAGFPIYDTLGVFTKAEADSLSLLSTDGTQAIKRPHSCTQDCGFK